MVGASRSPSTPVRTARDITHSREIIAAALFRRSAVARADFVFEGGNLSVDRAGDALRVFIGYNDLLMTVRAYRARGRRMTIAGAAENVSAWLGGAEVVVMGTDAQSPWLPHVDQAFALVGGQTAVVNTVDEGSSNTPVPIRDFSHVAGGSTHCLTNVIL